MHDRQTATHTRTRTLDLPLNLQTSQLISTSTNLEIIFVNVFGVVWIVNVVFVVFRHQNPILVQRELFPFTRLITKMHSNGAVLESC